VYLFDRLTKWWATTSLAKRAPIILIPHVLDLRYTENAGGAFSLFGGQPWLFLAATALVAMVIAVVSVRLTSRVTALGLGLILGGAMGNLTDRIARGSGASGRVVDFIDLHHWPVFNVADSAIVIGALVVLLIGMRQSRPAPGPPSPG
jgi:signal peptidase II